MGVLYNEAFELSEVFDVGVFVNFPRQPLMGYGDGLLIVFFELLKRDSLDWAAASVMNSILNACDYCV